MRVAAPAVRPFFAEGEKPASEARDAAKRLGRTACRGVVYSRGEPLIMAGYGRRPESAAEIRFGTAKEAGTRSSAVQRGLGYQTRGAGFVFGEGDFQRA